MTLLNVNGLRKEYDSFTLDNVSFSLDAGYIMGFIGSNGAGKTTTLKGILNIIHTDGGEVEIFGRKMKGNEIALKQDIAFMMGGSDYYPNSRVRDIAAVVKRFYENWNGGEYESYLRRFKIDPAKKIRELSRGMRIKFALALALSHEAKLIILDEPTSGLDPVARDNLLELFQELVEDGSRSILFSTHITSDLEKCADYITLIHNGKIIETAPRDELVDSYRLISGSRDDFEKLDGLFVARKKNSFGYSGLIKADYLEGHDSLTREAPTLDDIMIYYAKSEGTHE